MRTESGALVDAVVGVLQELLLKLRRQILRARVYACHLVDACAWSSDTHWMNSCTVRTPS